MKKCDMAKKYPVHFTVSDKIIDMAEGAYLLEEAEKNGIEMDADCREGVCGTCATKATGSFCFATTEHCLSPEQQRLGWILTCICKVQGPISVEE